MGLQPNIAFDNEGIQDIVITVFDASNNTASFAFKVEVNSPPSTAGLAGPAMMVLFVLCLTGVVSVLGFRSWQRRLAVELLTGRGLNEEEAQGHIGMVAQRRKISLFAKATEIAGLDQGEIQSKDDSEADAKAAEMEAIYGSSASTADPNLSFAPPPQYQAEAISQGSNQAALEAASLFDMEQTTAPSSAVTLDALAAFMDDEPEPAPAPVEQPVATSEPAIPPYEPEANRSEIQMPVMASEPQPAPKEVEQAAASVNIRHTCTACNAVFEIDMPSGVEVAVVGCPGCGVDQTITQSAS
jgi:hypothetical protein